MNYEEMSDFDINKAVAEALGVLKDNVDLVGCGDSINLFDFDKSVFIDYCNDPSDSWPIITENKIDFEWIGLSSVSAVEASNFDAKHSYEDSDGNALKACMIVFLKMKESQ